MITLRYDLRWANANWALFYSTDKPPLKLEIPKSVFDQIGKPLYVNIEVTPYQKMVRDDD